MILTSLGRYVMAQVVLDDPMRDAIYYGTRVLAALIVLTVLIKYKEVFALLKNKWLYFGVVIVR